MSGTVKLAVDCVVFDSRGRALLIKRKNEPFKGAYALPGGFVEYGESTEDAARRELREETDLRATWLELIGVYSDPNRDPRGHVVSVAYRAAVDRLRVSPGDDAAGASFVANPENATLAFDHARILADARRIR